MIATLATSAWREARENLLRVAAVTEGAIHRHFTRLRREHFENLRYQDGSVRAGRGFAGR